MGASRVLCAALWLAAANGCLYDSADRCGDHMRYLPALDACVCVEQAIAVNGGCRLCAEGEVVVNNACVAPPAEQEAP